MQESHCSWSKRLRLYNGFVQGNAELLSISSDDSIWNSDDEESSKKHHHSRSAKLNTEELTDDNTEDTSNEQESIRFNITKKTLFSGKSINLICITNQSNEEKAPSFISKVV